MKIRNSKFEIRNFRSGFTLIEAVVATALFATTISSILGVYVSTIQLDRKSRSQRAVGQNARYFMDFLAKEVRNGKIDYSGSNACTNSATTLCLINQTLEVEKFVWNGTDTITFVKSGNTTIMNSSNVIVTKLQFYLRPAGDPFTVAKTYNKQPSVTVVIEITSDYGQRPLDKIVLNLQDTFTEHYYPSRQ